MISENAFLMIWAQDFVSDKTMEISEYFVYFGIIIVHSRDKRFGQITKGVFSESTKNKRAHESLTGLCAQTVGKIQPLFRVVLH